MNILWPYYFCEDNIVSNESLVVVMFVPGLLLAVADGGRASVPHLPQSVGGGCGGVRQRGAVRTLFLHRHTGVSRTSGGN